MNRNGKRMVVSRSCFCELADRPHTCSSVARAGTPEVMPGIGKQCRATPCRGRGSRGGRGGRGNRGGRGGRGRKPAATWDGMFTLDEGKYSPPRATPAAYRQAVTPIFLKRKSSPDRRCFEDAANTREDSTSRWFRLPRESLFTQPRNEPTNVCSQPCIKKEASSAASSAGTSGAAGLLGLPRDMLSLPSAGVRLEGCDEDIAEENPGPQYPPLFTFGVFTNDILLE
ncbi:uncharacterized protein LOC125944036 isoform X2 [Dermacentor silvarum]|uniref:uncharacterized protein LOC125944036 isoform X2 n=1 Tax=Dermacentor silvarum TaxID=543639 RepID=UPI0021008688|nr:uncharacterized protein LOC125944036 isoform X2 [Dermacentor silvarum]